jgi:hypothetical protein
VWTADQDGLWVDSYLLMRVVSGNQTPNGIATFLGGLLLPCARGVVGPEGSRRPGAKSKRARKERSDEGVHRSSTGLGATSWGPFCLEAGGLRDGEPICLQFSRRTPPIYVRNNGLPYQTVHCT